MAKKVGCINQHWPARVKVKKKNKLINPRLLEYLGCNMQLAGHVNIVLIMLIVMDIWITVADVSVIPQLACGGWSATDEHHRFAGSDGSFGIR